MNQRESTVPTIFYFGNDWFADNRTSSHHIARRLTKRFPVYYIECPGLRPPKGSRRDLRKIISKFCRFFAGTKRVDEKLRVQTLLQLPFHRFSLIRSLNRILLTLSLRWLKWREGIRNPITWFVVPHLSNVAGHLGERLSVYYCIDDYAALPDVDREAIRRMDNELTRKADLVFVSAETLRQRKLSLNPNTYYSPHGVDYDLFAQAQDSRLPVPLDVARLPKPIVGFFGLIEGWVNLELIAELAKKRPQWTFLFIGRVALSPERLPRGPNLHFIGQRPYDMLPAYGKHFDVSIIPFHLTPVILHANPLKLREFLAMGKPVVSVSTPEIDKYADVVAIAHTPEEFLAKLDAVLARPSTPEEIRLRMKRVAAESWDARLNAVMEIIQKQTANPE